MFDLLVKEAKIVDGTGKKSVYEDLAVQEGVIVARGKNLGNAREILDAEGLILAPGFIDTHTHYDAQLTWDPMALPSPLLGVTTALIGNCGFTIAPCKEQHRSLTIKNLTQVEGMSYEALESGLEWNFKSFSEYLNFLESRGLGPNIAAYVGHSSVRVWVMGEEAMSREATTAEMEQMEELVSKAMLSGAIGFSTSTFEGHNGCNGVPMPSRLASLEEHQRLAKAMAIDGRGIYMLTRGSKTSLKDIESISSFSNRPAMIAALLHNPLNPSGIINQLDLMKEALKRGNELWGQVSCKPLTMEFTMADPYMFEGFKSWQPVLKENSLNKRRSLFKNKDFRNKLRDELINYGKVRVFNGDWKKIIFCKSSNKKYKSFEGKNVFQISADLKVDCLDWILDHALNGGMDSTFLALLLNNDDKYVGPILQHSNSVVSLSDAGAHLSFFCDAGYGLYFLDHWVKENKIISIEEAIYKLTGRQADIFRLPGRGRLVPGQAADMILFDQDTVGVRDPFRVNDLPGNASRLTTSAKGLEGVWVNGLRILENKKCKSGVLPGKLIREFYS